MAKNKKSNQKLSQAVRNQGPILSQKEAKAVAKQTNKSVAQVVAKATQANVAIGSKLGNQISKGLAAPGGSLAQSLGIWRAKPEVTQALTPLQGLQMNKGTAYSGYSTNNSTGTPAYNPIVLPRSVVTGVQRVGGGNKTATDGGGDGTNPAQATVGNWEESVNNSNQELIDSINAQIEANAAQAQLYMGQIDALMASMQQQQQGGGLGSLVPYATTTTTAPVEGAKLTTAITARKKPSVTDLSTGLLVDAAAGTGLNIPI